MNVVPVSINSAMPLEDKRPIVSPRHESYPVRTTFIDMGVSEVEERRRSRYSKKPECDTVRDDRKFVDRFREFGRNTTFHGLGFVTNNKYNPTRRLAWLAVVLTVTGVLISQIIALTLHYFTYPMTSTISINYVDKMTFPAVTLCNFNQYKKTSLTQEQLQFLTLIHGPQRAHNPINFDVLPDYTSELDNTEDFEEFVASVSHKLEDMLVECKWESTRDCTTSNFTRRFTDHGICFTFNEPANKSDSLSVRNAGSQHGLYMRLHAEHDEYTFGESTAAGFRVLLHPQGVLPLVKELGFSLSPGFESSVTVRQNKIKALKAPFQSNCTESKTNSSTVYTVATCRFECKVKYVVEKCGCRDYRWQGADPICDSERQVKCIYPTQKEFQDSDVVCDCPDSCQLTTYESRISMGYWPADYITAAQAPALNVSESKIRKNYLDVYIFFEELMYIQIEQTEAYGMSSLLGDLGGYMGLLCGMSVVTLAEWIDFIINTLCRKFRIQTD